MSITLSSNRRLLLQVRSDATLESLARPAAGLEALFAAPPVAGGQAPAAWLTANTSGGGALHPWDEAHRAVAAPAAAGLEAVPAPAYAEPDFVQRFPYRGPDDITAAALESASPCQMTGPDDFWPPASWKFGWHLGDDFSGLRAARNRVGESTSARVRIAHLDTGYDPEHVTLPLHLLTHLARNFVDGDPDDATDPGRHFPLSNPGHGTATLALLAGNRVQPAGEEFDDFLGGAPRAEVVPVRIADSVIHFYTSSMAAGIRYAIETGCQVLSVSMGGVPTRAWADAVNAAYEAGVALFAAAGNRIGPAPPRWIVYPARFGRVVAVCGATADKTPYYRTGLHRHMQGCFGPPSKMDTALATFTPNVPWAVMGCSQLLVHDGNGTSSATPQAAAAAALWLQQATVPADIEPWQRVEAIRNALFASADDSQPDGTTYFGAGLLRAARALDQPFRTDLPMTPADSVSFPWLRLAGVLEALPTGRDLMYEVEALQIFEQSADLQRITGAADPAADSLDVPTLKRLISGLRQSPLASQALREHLKEMYRRL
jgi:hypothetical protein